MLWELVPFAEAVAWTWPSVIWDTRVEDPTGAGVVGTAGEAGEAGVPVVAWIWPSPIWDTGATSLLTTTEVVFNGRGTVPLRAGVGRVAFRAGVGRVPFRAEVAL